MKLTTTNVVEVRCQGSPREMGFGQGAGVRNKIYAASQILVQLEAFRLQQPEWLPYPVYRWLAERKSRRYLAQCRDSSEMNQRLAGIAEGAGVSLNAICLFNAIEPMLSSVGGCTACPGACSAVAVRGPRSAKSEPMVAHNFDYLPLVQPLYMVRESRPTGGLRAFEFTTAPLAGAVDGINEKGLCITYDYAFTTDIPSAPAAPISVAISEALGRCQTVTEAADWITQRPRWGGGLLMLSDASGDIASLELSSSCSHLRRPEEGAHVLYHSNAFFSDTMRLVQSPRDAVYTDLAPTALRGHRLHQSSELRDQRFKELLERGEILCVDKLATVMADHGSAGIPHDYSPCVHSKYWQTTACLQFFPKSRRMRVAYDTACQARFVDIEF
jgi:hypothetical protein